MLMMIKSHDERSGGMRISKLNLTCMRQNISRKTVYATLSMPSHEMNTITRSFHEMTAPPYKMFFLHEKSLYMFIALFINHISLQCYAGCQKLAFTQFHIKDHHVYYLSVFTSSVQL